MEYKDSSNQTETIIAIVRREGDSMRPADTQCLAKVDGERCENDITFNLEGDYWSKLCKDHQLQDEKARKSGDPRVERFVSSEE